MSAMLAMGIIPIINENDAVSGNEGYTKVCVYYVHVP
jgi:glutamate 5-kinase